MIDLENIRNCRKVAAVSFLLLFTVELMLSQSIMASDHYPKASGDMSNRNDSDAGSASSEKTGSKVRGVEKWRIGFSILLVSSSV